jgi:hypothetical protein
MEVTGKLVDVMATNQVSEKFRKREFVLETTENPQYPEFICFELVQDKVDMIDPYQLGQQLTVKFDLRGRKWTSQKDGTVRYFNTLNAWRIDVDTSQQPQLLAQSMPTQQFVQPQQPIQYPQQVPVQQQPLTQPAPQPGTPAAYPPQGQQQYMQQHPQQPPMAPPHGSGQPQTQTAPPVPQQGTAGTPHVPRQDGSGAAEDNIPF